VVTADLVVAVEATAALARVALQHLGKVMLVAQVTQTLTRAAEEAVQVVELAALVKVLVV
jgi:hypothetical protein